MTKKQKVNVIFPISAKLVIIISTLLLLSLGAVTLIVSILGTQDVRITAEGNNFTVNSQAALMAAGSIRSVRAAVVLYLEMSEQIAGGVEPVQRSGIETERFFFNNNNNIAAIGIHRDFNALIDFIFNNQFLITNNITHEMIRNYFAVNSAFNAYDSGIAHERIRLFNASVFFRQPLTVILFNRQGKNGIEKVMVLFYSQDLSESFTSGINSTFFISDTGDVLFHPESDMVLGGANLSSMPLVAIMRQEGDLSRQVSFTDITGNRYFGAYSRITDTDAVAITTIPHDVVFEAMRSITIQNMFLTIAVLFITILFIWFFSKTISTPARTLADAALRIESGDFEINLKPKTKDELGLLTTSFGKMASALNVFGRFTNKDIAVRAMRGEIKPGGLSKHATIFFSDIRGFTEKSENFTKVFGNEASNQIVRWLNLYFTHMVNCVEKTGGVVDKFIGDAVMAHWGTAFTAGSPEADAFNCVKAALMMRSALYKLNAQRKKNDPGDPYIQIGCGINTGIVTAGQIGSEQRMEYTVIGDPVNLASRAEALNKPLGTDILITENTWALVKNKFITEEMPSVTVKGKEKPVKLFAVVNMFNVAGPKTLTEVRELLGITAVDINKVNTDDEEKKFKIQTD